MALPKKLQQALSGLDSPKIKERTAALEDTASLVGPAAPSTTLDRVPRGAWVDLLNPLFSVIILERNGYDKEVQDSSKQRTVAKRMEQGSGLLRCVVERSASQFPRKAVKALFKHCFTVLVIRNKIFQPLALDTIKTLNALLAVRQHLEHLEDRQWLDLVRIGIGTALGSPVRLDSGMDDETFLSDTESEAEGEGTSSKKKGKARAKDSSQEIHASDLIEAFNMLAHLMHSPSANLILLPQASALLHKYVKLFRLVMPPYQDPITEVTSHTPLLQAFNGLLSNLVDNASVQLKDVAPSIWLQLSRFWPGIRRMEAKEQTLIALKRMSPVIFTLSDRALAQQCCKAILDVLLGESSFSRGRVEELSLEALQMRASDRQSSSSMFGGVFELQTLCWAPTHSFGAGQAISWTLLQLAADCLFHLFHLGENVGATQTRGHADEPGPTKRRKIDDPVSDFLHTLATTANVRERVHHLQILTFFTSLRWKQLHSELQVKTMEVLLQLLTDDDSDIRSWTFCCLAAVVFQGTSDPAPFDVKSATPSRTKLKTSYIHKDNPWELVWTAALRNLSNRPVCRAAAHTAACILEQSSFSLKTNRRHQALLDADSLRSSLSTLIDDLAVQGPGFPSDSVCGLLAAFVRFSRNDSQLFQAQVPSKLFAWLSTAWKPDARRSRLIRGEWEDPVAILWALFHLVGLDSSIPLTALALEVTPPQCPIVKAAVEDAATVRVRDFLYNSRLDLENHSTKTSEAATSAPAANVDTALAHQIIAYFQQALEALLPEDDEAALPSLSYDALQRAVKLVSVSLLFFGAVRSRRPQAQRSLTRTASRLLHLLLPYLGSSRWNVSEKASFLTSLGLLFPSSISSAADNSLLEGLIYPGSTSNVPRCLRHEAPAVPNTALYGILGQLWASDDLRTLLGENNGPLTLFLHHMAVNASLNTPGADGQDGEGVASVHDTTQRLPAATQKASQIALSQMNHDQGSDDGFGTILDAAPAGIKRKAGGGSARNAKSTASRSSCMAAPDYSAKVLTITSLRGLLAAELANKPTSTSLLTGTQILPLLFESEGESFLSLLESLLALHATASISLSLGDADALFEMIGSSFLPAYEYARSPKVYSLTIHLLAATVGSWLAAARSGREDLSSNARKLCSWLSDVQNQSRLSAWNVRLDLVVFLDTFARCDPREELWGDEDLLHTEDGSPIVPTRLIPEMIKDPDFRVRFRVCSSSARIMEAMEEQQVDISAYFRGLMLAAPATADVPELMLSRILCCGNLMVVMSYIRRMAYESLLDISRTAPGFGQHLLSTLAGAARRLGLPSIASLFKAFIGYYAYRKSNTLEQAFFQQLPLKVCGFTSNSARAENVFDELGAFYLSTEDQSHFVSLRKQAGIDSNAHAIRRCFPNFVARTLLDTAQTCFETMQDATEALDQALTRIKLAFESSDQPVSFDHFLSASLDRVLGCVFDKLHSSTFDATSTVSAALSAFVRPSSHNPGVLYHSLVSGVPAEPIYSHGQDYEPTPCLQVCMLLLDQYSSSDQYLPLAYNVLRHLIAQIPESVFLDDQRRLMGCLVTACVVFMDALSDPAIARLLAHGCASLYTVEDLLQQSWSIFVTVVAIYLRNVDKAPRGTLEIVKTLPAIIVNVAHAAQSYLAKGFTLNHLDQLHRQVYQRLARSADQRLQRQSTLVSLLWSDHPEVPMFSLIDFDFILQNIENLDDSSLRLIEPLCKSVEKHPSPSQAQHVGRLLWVILNSADQTSTITPAISEALSSVLSACGGQILPHGLGRPRHRTAQISLPTTNFDMDAFKELLVESAAGLLLIQDLKIADAAAQALREIFDVAQPGQFETSVSLADTARDIVYLASPSLRRHIFSPTKKIRLSLADLPAWAKVTTVDATRWCPAVTEILLSSLGHRDSFFLRLIPLLRQSTRFASTIFPFCIYGLLLQQDVFTDAATSLSTVFNTILFDDMAPKQAVTSIVDAMLYLRGFEQPDDTANHTSRNAWLDVSWRAVALGAIRTHGAATALLCMELAHDQHSQLPLPEPPSSKLQQLQYRIYENIDEPDGFYSIVAEDLAEGLLRKYTHEGRAEAAYRMSGAKYEAAAHVHHQSQDVRPVVQSMAASGFASQAIGLLRSGDQAIESDLRYDLAWRTGSWDLPLPAQELASDSAVATYTILRSVQQGADIANISHLRHQFMQAQTRRLLDISANNPTPSHEAVSTLLVLREMRSLDTHISESMSLEQVERLPFTLSERVLSARIRLLALARHKEESIQWTNMASEALTHIVQAEQACHLSLSQAARRAEQPDIALTSVTAGLMLVTGLQEMSEEPCIANWLLQLREEQAFVMWQRGEHSEALKLMERLSESLQGKDAAGGHQVPARQALILSQLGVWMTEARIRSDSDIHTQYFKPAIEHLAGEDATESRAIVHLQFARFADAQLKMLQSQEEEMRRLSEAQSKRQQQLVDLRSRAHDSQGSRKSQLDAAWHESSRVATEEKKMLAQFQSTRNRYMRLSMEQTIKVLALTDKHDDLVYRLVALWFSSSAPQTSDKRAKDKTDKLHSELSSQLQHINSAKFVFLAPQLTARLSKQTVKDSAVFKKTLANLIDRLTADHPFHLLYLLYNLRHSGTAPGSSKKSRRTSSVSSESLAQAARVKAAEDVVNRLKSNDTFRERLSSADLACDAYHQWADFNAREVEGDKKRRAESHRLPANMSLRKLQNISLPVSTCHLRVDPSARYDDPSIPTIQRYDESYKIAGGLNRPKISDCIGSDGKRYKQLFKGGDDTRQDAVMEQVFGLVNILLAQDAGSARRHLHIRTYQIIPLRAKTGAMEFVSDSQSIQEVLSTLLAKVYPKDLDYVKCRRILTKARDDAPEDKSSASASPDQARMTAALQSIYLRNRPVMRFKFFEAHKQPSQWFEMRLNYTRSVAVVSIVGYILGIGDRHLSNLLLDTVQGELVPIDFGYAFDGATRLAIPETVPFRLTRNIIDGFGTSGVEGVYRRCCEETFRVMRARESVVMTVLDVFKYDPLQRWDVSFEKVQRAQGSSTAAAPPPKGYGLERTSAMASVSEDDRDDSTKADDYDANDVPALAEQALRVVSDKIKSNGLSVEYKVNELIQQATDPARLSMLFAGWQPYA